MALLPGVFPGSAYDTAGAAREGVKPGAASLTVLPAGALALA
jgi:hypothetical protein